MQNITLQNIFYITKGEAFKIKTKVRFVIDILHVYPPLLAAIILLELKYHAI
jgi:hypothetical protein